MGQSPVAAAISPKPSIPRHECLKHVWDQHYRVNRFAINLRVQRGIAIEVHLEAGCAREGQLDAFSLWQRTEAKFCGGCDHRDVPLLKKSG